MPRDACGPKRDCPPVKPCREPEHIEPMKCGEPLNFSGELALFDSIAQEHVSMIATPLDYWSQNVPATKNPVTFDGIYAEPRPRNFAGPFRLQGYVKFPQENPEVREEGLRIVYRGELWVARKDFEDKQVPSPAEGDIVRFWNIPFYESYKVNSEGYYFDVTFVQHDGHVLDTANFVGFTFMLQRRTEYLPERRLEE